MLDHGTVIAGYRLEGVLGRGGMGTVFRARHLDSGRLVALKLITDGAGAGGPRDERFRGEGRAQALLDHPHVVTVFEAGQSEYGPFLTMRLVDGPALAELMRERLVGARRALALLAQVADALDAAHAEGLVHRDVKPQNVLVDGSDQAYLADFGLTRVGAQTSLTASGAIVGTVAYLAPEVVRGDEATPASDRYAFAAMAFECLAGTVVYPRASDAAVLFAHAGDPPPRISARRPELGDGLDALFKRALAKDPSERPDGAGQLVEAIRRRMARSGTIELPPPPALSGEAALRRLDTTSDPVPALPVPAAAPARAGRRRMALAALGGAAAVAAAWIAFGGDGGERPAAASPDRPGLRYLGADLAGPPGRTLDCRGRPPGGTSPACTVAQTRLPGSMLVVPRDGVIRRWSVRAARGEVTLAVLRPRAGGALQVATSSTETVGSADVQSFGADIAVERGDLVGLRVTPGSGVGVRDGARGAATQRWLPPVTGFGRPPDRVGGTGFDHELLLRVGLLPGGRPRPIRQRTGSAAERLPAGRVREQRALRVGGRRVVLALVEVDGGFALDRLVAGRRAARIEVPGLKPGATIVRFVAALWSEQEAGLDLSFVNADSATVVQQAYAVNADGFTRVR